MGTVAIKTKRRKPRDAFEEFQLKNLGAIYNETSDMLIGVRKDRRE